MEELVKKAKEDDEAFDELINSMKNDLYCIARTRLDNLDDIADAIQDTILTCYKNIQKLKNNKVFKTWLIKILISKCNNIYNKKKKYNISIEENEMDKYIEVNDNLEKMNFEMFIRNLSLDEQTILTLYYYSGYTTKEIGHIMGKNENTIKTKIRRAKDKLREEYGGELYERN